MATGDKRSIVMEFDRAVPNGVATLGEDGKLAKDQCPDYSVDQITGLEKALDQKQGTLIFDADPTADSENPVKSGGVYDALTKKQNTLTGAPGQLIGIGDDGAAQATVYPSNKNLLDNWYFVGGGSQQGGGQFPINQRGNTTWLNMNGAYFIDRWYSSRAELTLKENGISFAWNGTEGNNGWIQQRIETTEPIGKTVTASALIDNKLYTVTGTVPTSEFPTDLHFKDIGIELSVNKQGNTTSFIIYTTSITPKIVKAAKLELGPVQTLAHKEGDNWVLNDPPPNYALELAKCQRYQVVLERNDTQNIGFGKAISNSEADVLIYGFNFRVKPAVTVIGNSALSLRNTVATSTPVTGYVAISNNGFSSKEAVLMRCTAENLETGNIYFLRAAHGQSMKVILDANL